jgi:hypothetical protein
MTVIIPGGKAMKKIAAILLAVFMVLTVSAAFAAGAGQDTASRKLPYAGEKLTPKLP